PRGAEIFRLVQRPTIDRIVRGQSHAPVVPGRLRVPLIPEVEEVDADSPGERQLEARIALELERGGRVEQVGDVDLAFLQHRRARRGFRNTLDEVTLNLV